MGRSNVFFEFRDFCGIICYRFRLQLVQSLSRIHVAGIALEGFAKRSCSALSITLLLESGAEKVLGLGGIGLQVESVPEFGNGFVVLTLVERSLAFCDVEVRILFPVISRGKLPAFLDFCRRLVFASSSSQR